MTHFNNLLVTLQFLCRLSELKVNKNTKKSRKQMKEEEEEEMEEDDRKVREIVDLALMQNVSDSDSEMSTEAKEELPWCHLCNDDAQLRCTDCDGDLYCRRCWKECHKSGCDSKHQFTKYP